MNVTLKVYLPYGIIPPITMLEKDAKNILVEGLISRVSETRGTLLLEIDELIEDNKVKVMTKLESQGTEFNSVICINERERNVGHSERFRKIMESINRNSDYIGYARAVEKLEVLIV